MDAPRADGRAALSVRGARAGSIAFVALAGLLAAAWIALLIVRSVEPLGLDQGLFACFARWVPRGWLPYRDLFDSKPPLFLYAWSLSSLVPAEPRQAAWILEALWLLATALVAGAWLTRMYDRWVALAGTSLLLYGLFAPGWGGYWSRMQAEELLPLPLCAAAWLAWRARDRERLAWWAGVLGGAAGLMKIPSLAVMLAWPLLWLGCERRATLRRVAWLAAGLAAPWAATVAWFAAHGALGPFVEGVFVYQRHFAAIVAPPWSTVVSGFTQELVGGAALLVVLAAVGLGSSWRRGAREAPWLTAWLVLACGAVVAQRQLAGYHFLFVVPPLAVAGGIGLVALVRALSTREAMRLAVAALGTALVVALAVRDVAAWSEAYAPDLAASAGRLTRDEYLQRMRRGGFSPFDEERAARFIAAHTRPDDGILVWGLSPGLYALAGRHPTTRFPFHKILLTEAPLSRAIPSLDGRRRALLERLAVDPPAYVLVGCSDANSFDPEESTSSLARFTALQEWLERGYRLETELGPFLIYRRSATP